MKTAGDQGRMAIVQYGLAFLGIHLAFMPLMVLLLPRRVEAIAPYTVTETLSLLLIVGAVVAGAAHIAAGAASDHWIRRKSNRRGLIIIGLIALEASHILLAFAGTVLHLLGALVLFQIALNCAFAPLGALLADHFSDETKGRMGGIMNAALPASSLAIVLLGWLFPVDGPAAFIATGVMVLLFMAPLLILWPLGDVRSTNDAGPALEQHPAQAARRDFQIAWCARLIIQLGAALVLGYIYVLLSSVLVSGSEPAADRTSGFLAALSAPAALLAIFSTLLAGALSDRQGRRRPLMFAALVFAAGLAILSGAQTFAAFIAGYAMFYVGLSAFLSIDTALVAQLVSANPRRGMLLGVMNLTNTLPAVIAPAITLLAYREAEIQSVLGQLFLLTGGLALLASLGIRFIRTVR